jgi:hypothetical protein
VIRFLPAAAALALLAATPGLHPARAAKKVKARAAKQDQGWGIVKGQVNYGGAKLPPLVKIDVPGQFAKACGARGALFQENWVINKKNKGVRYVLVWLAPFKKNGKIPIHPKLLKSKAKEVVMDQPCCQFEPHVVGLWAGQNLLVKNSASIQHNVHWLGLGNNAGNVLIPKKKSHTIKDLTPQKLPMPVSCDIHKWMKGWVGIYDHPYFAVTDKDGKFEIKDAPAGQYRLFVWQESVGYIGGVKGRNGQVINIKKGGVTDLKKLKIKETE